MPAIVLPFTFTPDTVADANQINANFRAVTPGTGVAQSGNLPVTQPITSTLGLMMGFGVIITPAVTGRLLVCFQGTLVNSVGGAAGAATAVNYGTGTPPAYGAARTGTRLLQTIYFDNLTGTTNLSVPFTFVGLAAALTVGTAYWFDLVLATVEAAGQANVADTGYTVIEI